MTTEIEYALMAGHAYLTNRDELNWIPAPTGWKPFFHVPDQTTASIFPATAGFEAIAFKNTANPNQNEIVISYAGTNFSSIGSDFLHGNIPLAMGIVSDQLIDAAKYYLQIRKDNPTATITLTGHSLGGGIAALISVFFGETAFTFDQAPFAETAKFGATILRDSLLSKGYTSADLGGLNNYIQLQQANVTLLTPIPNEGLVTNINTQGEIVSLGSFIRIGTDTSVPNSHAGVSAVDLHSHGLLTAFLQSQQNVPYDANNQAKSLNQVTFKLPDLLKMIFDPKLFAHTVDRSNTTDENFLERLVKHQACVQPDAVSGNGAIPADAMVTRFTADLWKLAQDGGITLNDNAGWANMHLISKTLTAFAMQFYYEDTSNATDQTKQLFTDLTTAGAGSPSTGSGQANGIQFDMHDVSKEVAAAMDANAHVDLTKAKGYKDFQTYIETSVLLTSEERTFIKSMLPQLRDWYVQAGASGMTAIDTLNSGAFMLGGNAQDTLTGGTKADLLVGNAGDDILKGGDGSDVLIGGTGVDTYAWNASANAGIDTILDSDKQGYLRDDSPSTGSGQAGAIVLTGGTQYGDNRVFSGKDANGTNHIYTYPSTSSGRANGDAANDSARRVTA